jgi:hypothetical protein
MADKSNPFRRIHCLGFVSCGQDGDQSSLFCPPNASPLVGQLMGMNEITEKMQLPERCQNEHAIVQRVIAAANLSRVPCGSDKECR